MATDWLHSLDVALNEVAQVLRVQSLQHFRICVHKVMIAEHGFLQSISTHLIYLCCKIKKVRRHHTTVKFLIAKQIVMTI